MKLTQFNTKIFVQELNDLSHMIDTTVNQAQTWINGQEARGKGQAIDQYRMQGIRMSLEDRLNELREKLALVYDFQGDRGMADFAPAGFNNGNDSTAEDEEDEEDGVDPFDFYLFPGKEKKMCTSLVLYDPEVAAKQLQLALVP